MEDLQKSGKTEKICKAEVSYIYKGINYPNYTFLSFSCLCLFSSSTRFRASSSLFLAMFSNRARRLDAFLTGTKNKCKLEFFAFRVAGKAKIYLFPFLLFLSPGDILICLGYWLLPTITSFWKCQKLFWYFLYTFNNFPQNLTWNFQ